MILSFLQQEFLKKDASYSNFFENITLQKGANFIEYENFE
jgi:hypothetical protein